MVINERQENSKDLPKKSLGFVFLGNRHSVRPARECFRSSSGRGRLTNLLRFLDVDPRELRVSSARPSGADPYKLQRQIAQFGSSAAGMPPIWVYQGSAGVLVIFNGVTRATRIAKLAPGRQVRVEVIGRVLTPCQHFPKIGDLLP